MAGLAFSWGTYVAMHPGIFTDDATRAMFSGMAQMAGEFPPSALWGISGIVIGLVRAMALFINGAYTRTPLVRLLMSFASIFIWTQIVIGLIKSGVPNTGLVVYSGLVVMDVVSAWRAATDMVFAEKMRHDLKQERRRVASSIFP